VKPLTLLRLSLAGTRTDVLRVVLTAVSALLATVTILAALTVLAIPTPGGSGSNSWSEQYASPLLREPGLRGGTALALVMLTIPILALAGQCGRLGAPARERRLAGFRLAGASPGQAVLIAVAETGVAALLGALAGLGAYLGGREILHRPDARGQLALPTDVLPATPLLVATVLALPLVAAAATALLMRRVTIGPFGVVRRAPRQRPPRPWPGILIAIGFALFAGLLPFARWYSTDDRELPPVAVPLAMFGGTLTAAVGAILGAGWISYTVGRLLLRHGRRPASLLAARRLVADPWSGSRTLAALLACVLFGGGAVGVRAWLSADRALQEDANRMSAAAQGVEYIPDDQSFYTRTLDLVDLAVWVGVAIAAAGLLVALAEGIVSRRRTYASLVATGVPRGTLAGAILWQVGAPAVPAIALALAVGAVLPRGIATEVSRTDSSCVGDVCTDLPTVTRAVPVLWGDLLAFGAGGVVAVLVMAAVGLLFLRSSTAVEELRIG
jgi:hypothetical protein